jgi:hypothetical protein
VKEERGAPDNRAAFEACAAEAFVPISMKIEADEKEKRSPGGAALRPNKQPGSGKKVK